MHHFFFLSLYLAWLGGWINLVQPHLHLPVSHNLTFVSSLGKPLESAHFVKFIPITDLPEESVKWDGVVQARG